MHDASVRSYSTKQRTIATDAILQNPQDGEDRRCFASGLHARLRNALGAWLAVLPCALGLQGHAEAAPLKITSVSPSGGNVVVRWEGGTGPFQLLCRTNFADAWQKAGQVTSGYTATVAAPPGPSCFFLVTTDVTPPSVPGNLRATTNSCGQITVTWTASSDGSGSGVKNYLLYRNETLLGSFPAGTHAAIDGGLFASTTYFYSIAAVDWVGNQSVQSPPATTGTPACPNLAPIASASPPSTNTVVGVMVPFDGTGSRDPDGTITNYNWNFGDGTSNTGPATATHAFNGAGTYYVKLTVTDNRGASATGTTVVNVATPPASGQFITATTVGAYDSNDAGQAMAVDRSGNLLLGGTVSFHPWLTKRSPDGGTLWTIAMGGVGSGSIQSIATDSNNDVLVSGYFYGTINFGGTSLSSAGGYDIFVAKYTASGALVWARRFGSPRIDTLITESGTGVAVDTNNGNAVVLTGFFDGAVDFGGGTMTSTSGGDFFLVRFTSAGAHVWSRRAGGADIATGNGVVIDAGGNIYVAGGFASAINFGSGTVTNIGSRDMFFAKYNSSGTSLWVKTYGTRVPAPCLTAPTALALDGGSNLVIAGYFQTTMQLGGPTLTNSGYYDVFLAKYSTASGAHVWSKKFGGAGPDYGYGVAVDPATARITLTGTVRTAVDFGGGLRSPAAAGQAAFVANFAADGSHRWSKVMGGGAEEGRAVASSPFGKVYATGRFANTVNFGGGPVTSAGLSDLFLVEFTP